ncbi:hypothetical protein H5410_036090 [Solanum commersonii]|uniref:Response regulatory domain-containing protein n=1 Tax=Solanum commersonii TaxID=4109 RepID=A0A9J5Y4E4_SOLCO|nr:hypothetical protein H5410_036090 [Solanum commersonii]
MEVQNSEFFEQIRTLVVDDDGNCLLIIATLLKQSKFEVTIVKSAKYALSVLRSSGLSFDLVITKVHMPEMNDFQLQQEIAKDFGIPIVCEFIIFYILHKTRISFLFKTFGS